MILLIVAIAVIVGGLFYLLKKKGLSLTQAEQKIVSGIVSEEQKALDMFSSGKEAVIAEYETLKQRVKNAVGLQNKLPMPSVPVPAALSTAVIPVSVMGVPSVGTAPIQIASPIPPPVTPSVP